jgi:hypothetical protein
MCPTALISAVLLCCNSLNMFINCSDSLLFDKGTSVVVVAITAAAIGNYFKIDCDCDLLTLCWVESVVQWDYFALPSDAMIFWMCEIFVCFLLAVGVVFGVAIVLQRCCWGDGGGIPHIAQ